MRTTVIIDESLAAKLEKLASQKKLSDFINLCLREHFEREEKERHFQKLEKAYARASSGVKSDFENLDVEEWPEW